MEGTVRKRPTVQKKVVASRYMQTESTSSRADPETVKQRSGTTVHASKPAQAPAGDGPSRAEQFQAWRAKKQAESTGGKAVMSKRTGQPKIQSSAGNSDHPKSQERSTANRHINAPARTNVVHRARSNSSTTPAQAPSRAEPVGRPAGGTRRAEGPRTTGSSMSAGGAGNSMTGGANARGGGVRGRSASTTGEAGARKSPPPPRRGVSSAGAEAAAEDFERDVAVTQLLQTWLALKRAKEAFGVQEQEAQRALLCGWEALQSRLEEEAEARRRLDRCRAVAAAHRSIQAQYEAMRPLLVNSAEEQQQQQQEGKEETSEGSGGGGGGGGLRQLSVGHAALLQALEPTLHQLRTQNLSHGASSSSSSSSGGGGGTGGGGGAEAQAGAGVEEVVSGLGRGAAALEAALAPLHHDATEAAWVAEDLQCVLRDALGCASLLHHPARPTLARLKALEEERSSLSIQELQALRLQRNHLRRGCA